MSAVAGASRARPREAGAITFSQRPRAKTPPGAARPPASAVAIAIPTLTFLAVMLVAFWFTFRLWLFSRVT